MTEIDVTVTDYLLCLESLIFVWIIGRQKYSPQKTPFLILFGSFALSSFLGGTYHGFIKNPILWQATLICIGVTAYGFALTAIPLLINPLKVKLWNKIVLGLLLIFVGITFVSQTFLTVIVFYLPATIFALAGLIQTYKKTPNHSLKIGIIGLILSLIAPIIQQLNISIHPQYFTHNAVYHLIIMIALYFYFQAVLFLIGHQRSIDC